MYTPDNTPEDTQKDKKVILIVVAVFFVGIIIGSTGVAFLFRDALRFRVPTPEEIGQLTFPNERQIPRTETNILLPMELVTEEYHQLLNGIVNGLNDIATENNEALLPLMNDVKEKGSQGDFADLFNTILHVRNEIEKLGTMLVSVQENINKFEEVNNKDTTNKAVHDGTTVLIGSGYALTGIYIDYLQTLNTTFSGQVPSQELLDKLTNETQLLTSANATFELNLNTLLETVISEQSE
ncbi:hypothetical protein ACFL6I_18140 [candidate division KSB1 bacterium]